MLARVLSYELTLQDRAGEAVGVAVVYEPGNPASEANAEAWYQALNGLGAVRIKGLRFFVLKIPHDPKTLATAIDKDGADVLLASTDLGSAPQEDHKPKIYVNLNNAELERIRFGSNLLRLTILVR